MYILELQATANPYSNYKQSFFYTNLHCRFDSTEDITLSPCFSMPVLLCSIRPRVLSHNRIHVVRHAWCFPSWSSSSPSSSVARLSHKLQQQQQQCCRRQGTTRGGRRTVHSNNNNSIEQELSDDASLLWLLLQRAAVAAGFVHLFTEYIADITLCEGPSMLPTLALSGDVILVEKVSTTTATTHAGFRDGESAFGRTQAARRRQDEAETPTEWHAPALPHGYDEELSWQQAWQQQVWGPISTGDVVVADHPRRTGAICKRVVGLPGDQVIERGTGKIQRVPDGHVWLEGDNARQSKDSRSYGPVPAALVKGRVVARVWPVRGSAWMQRLRPSSTVLPAGYRGEHIVKSESEIQTKRKT